MSRLRARSRNGPEVDLKDRSAARSAIRVMLGAISLGGAEIQVLVNTRNFGPKSYPRRLPGIATGVKNGLANDRRKLDAIQTSNKREVGQTYRGRFKGYRRTAKALEETLHKRYGFAPDHVRKEVEDWLRWQNPKAGEPKHSDRANRLRDN